jgi:RNA polymerase sigma-70 factor (ECF subfamily)
VNAYNPTRGDTAEGTSIPLNSSSFDTIFVAHYEPIARAIARIVRDPGRAEELAIDAFWKLLRNPQAQGEHAGAWLQRTATRLALDELRHMARKQRYERLLPWIQPRSPDDLFSANEEQGRVRAVLAAIPPRDGEILLLRHDGASYSELASSLHLNEASVGTLLSRAQQAFRKEYVKRYGER